MKVDSFYESAWSQDITLELKGRSVDEIYKHFLFQIAPHLQQHGNINTKTAIELSKEHAALQKQIDILNSQIRNEVSVAKRQEFARMRHKLEDKKNGTIGQNISGSEAGDL